MLHKLSLNFGNILIKYVDKNTENLEVYAFGIEMIIMHIIHFLIMVLIGIMCKRPIETLIFIGVYAKMRTTAGGQHFKSSKVCFLTSICLILIVMIPINMQLEKILLQCPNFFLMCGILAVYFFAPCDNSNKPMNSDEKKMFRKKTICWTGVFSFAYIICLYTYPVVGYIISISFFLEAVGLVWGTIQNRKSERLDYSDDSFGV